MDGRSVVRTRRHSAGIAATERSLVFPTAISGAMHRDPATRVGAQQVEMTLGHEVADPVAAEPVAQSQGAAGPTRVPESEGHGDDPRCPLGFCNSLPKSMQNS
jgi:hypothetical protein